MRSTSTSTQIIPRPVSTLSRASKNRSLRSEQNNKVRISCGQKFDKNSVNYNPMFEADSYDKGGDLHQDDQIPIPKGPWTYIGGD